MDLEKRKAEIEAAHTEVASQIAKLQERLNALNTEGVRLEGEHRLIVSLIGERQEPKKTIPKKK